jgi:hypothetical protein
MGGGDPSPHLWRFGQPGDADLVVQPLQPPVDKHDLSTTQGTGKPASRRGERGRARERHTHFISLGQLLAGDGGGRVRSPGGVWDGTRAGG